MEEHELLLFIEAAEQMKTHLYDIIQAAILGSPLPLNPRIILNKLLAFLNTDRRQIVEKHFSFQIQILCERLFEVKSSLKWTDMPSSSNKNGHSI